MPNSKRITSIVLLMSLLFMTPIFEAQEPVPTLVPPTPIPRPESAEQTIAGDPLERILAEGQLRVGVLYNEPPFGEFALTGELRGYEPDVARALAEAWGVDVEFVQVTRQNRIAKVLSGEIDLLMAAVVHDRALDAQLAFSHTYRQGQQSIMIRADDESVVAPVNLASRSVGYVIGTPGETALNTLTIPLRPQMYLTYDRAVSALFGGEVDAVVGRRERLLRAASTQLEAIRVLDVPIALEPFAIALAPQAVDLRTLVNRTLQYLVEDETLINLHETYFPGQEFPFDAVPLWANVGEDAPTPSQYADAATVLRDDVLSRVNQSRVLRVAGLQSPDSLPVDQRSIQEVSQNVLTQLATTLGLEVQVVPGDPVSLLENGQADIAIGLEPDWNLANRVDFSQPYMMHGDRLLVPANSNIVSFVELRGNPYIAIVREDVGAQDRASELAASVNRRVRFFTTDAEGVAISILDDLNANVAFGDSLYLVPQQRVSSGGLEFTERWYSREFVSFAYARGERDFGLLLDYTLQDMVADGRLRTILVPITPPEEEPPQFDVWPGMNSSLGFNLG